MSDLTVLSEDVRLSFLKHSDREFHCVIGLVVPELSEPLLLLRWLVHVSFKELMFRCELDGRGLDAEEDAFFSEVDRLNRGEVWRKC